MDSTAQFNVTFPKAMLEELKGNNTKAKTMLWEIARNQSNPFSGYAFKILYSLGADLEEYITALNDYLVNEKSTPLREKSHVATSTSCVLFFGTRFFLTELRDPVFIL